MGTAPPFVPDGRRTARRAQTIEEILGLALDVMAEQGAGAVTFAEVARRLGVRAPSIYKYFPSVLGLYDELFRRGQQAHLEAVRESMAEAEAGLPAITAGLLASVHWGSRNQALAQLLFWRPVPGFEPSVEAFAPSIAMVELFAAQLDTAVDAGQLPPDTDRPRVLNILAIIGSGAASQYLANEPGTDPASSRYVSAISTALDLLAAGLRAPGSRAPATTPRQSQ